ncbi:hypothetical protein [uncultured Sphingomonas sp.]|uniref:hypothetical protein n=1 Tax=uncultured Sphingomonas sp. TaxID=158754 RepID=UPI002621CF20|nr:hypothetical protein [uncultured Sphingomonas sp.]
MKMTGYSVAAIAAIALTFVTTAGVAFSGSARSEQPEPKPGDGVLCLWALTSVASEVGKHCPGKNDPAFQTALDQSVAVMDQYVLVNGRIDATGIAKFKAQQGGVGQSAAELCTPDKTQIYDHLHSQGADAIREAVRKAVARPGTPAWGDCV